jgi:predicted transposase/invertase (TIGR01784 family)
LDVRAITDKGDYLDIEIQLRNTKEIPERSVVYTAEGLKHITKINDSYKKHKSIGIWILDENITDRTDAIGKVSMMYEASKNDGVEKYADNLRIITIELQKFHPKNEDNMKILTAWLAFIKNPYILMEDFLKPWLNDKDVSDAVKRLEYISCDEDVREIEDERRRSESDRISEMNEALEKQKQELKEKADAEKAELKAKADAEKAELKAEAAELRAKAEAKEAELRAKAEAEKVKSAKNLLAAGVNVEVVASSLGLSIDEINAIKKKIQ